MSGSLQKLDPTLVEAAGRAASKMQYQINRLEKRAAQAELRRTEILTRHAAQIENSLYPKKSLQEREIAGLYFYAKYGPELIDQPDRAGPGALPGTQSAVALQLRSGAAISPGIFSGSRWLTGARLQNCGRNSRKLFRYRQHSKGARSVEQVAPRTTPNRAVTIPRIVIIPPAGSKPPLSSRLRVLR